MEAIRQLIQDAMEFARDMTRTQGAAIGALILTVGSMLIFAMWLGKSTETDKVPLPITVEPSNFKALQERLEAEGYGPVEYRDKKIWVKADQVRKATMFLAKEDLLPEDSGSDFEDMLEKWHWTDTQALSEQRKKISLQTEIARMIESLDDIKKATVVYSDTNRRGYFSPRRKLTASVFVETELGRDLKRETANTIIALIAAAKTSLAEKDVVVSDQKSRRFRAKDPDGLSEMALEKFGLERRLEEEFRDKIEKLILALYPNIEYGGFTEVLVDAKVDYDKYESKTESVLEGPNQRTRAEKVMRKSSRGPAEQVGVVTNTVGLAGTATGGGGGTVEREEETRTVKEATKQNGLKIERLQRAPWIKSVAVTVIVRLPYKLEEMKADDKTAAEGKVSETKRKKISNPEVELKGDKLAELKRSIALAAGIDVGDIKDKIEVIQVAWMPPVEEPEESAKLTEWFTDFMSHRAWTVAMSVFLLICVYFIYAQAKRALPAEDLALPGEADLMLETTPLLSEGDRAGADFEALRTQVADFVSDDPRKAANLLRRWITKE